MRKSRGGGEKNGKNGGEKEKTDGNSGHYVIASSQPPERRPLECRTLVPSVRNLFRGKGGDGQQKIT